MLSPKIAGLLLSGLLLFCSAPPAGAWAVTTFYAISGQGRSTL